MVYDWIQGNYMFISYQNLIVIGYVNLFWYGWDNLFQIVVATKWNGCFNGRTYWTL